MDFCWGEHGMMGKNFGPMYDEVIHIPFFLYDPNHQGHKSCEAIAQTIDVAPTLLDFFNIDYECM